MQKVFGYHRCFKALLVLAGKYKKRTEILVLLEKAQEKMILRNESKQ